MSTVKSIYLQHLNGTTPNATMDTNGNFTVGGTVSGASSNMFRNRIINGDMRIDQRNAGASVTYDGSANYSIDRYYSSEIGNGSFTVQRVADAPAGFTHSLKVTVTAAQTGTLNAGTMQLIEGFNIADFAWGTASAKSITVSFWIKSSVTGTMSGAIQNSGNARSYVFSYTVNAANTWEYKTVTITGDTSGTWNTDNTTGLNIRFSHGSSITSTANSWSSNDYRGLTGGTYVIQTNGAAWQITGLQIEVGTAATPFEFRSYGHELTLCQRYYQKTYDIGTVPGTATYVNIQEINGYNGTNSQHILPFMFTMRATPSVSIWDGAGNANRYSSAASGSVGWFGDNLGTITLPTIGSRSVILYPAASSAYTFCIHYAASAEL